VEKAHSIAFRIKIEDAVDLPDYIDDIRALALLNLRRKRFMTILTVTALPNLRVEGR
jgi:hypothetical protein